MKTLIFSIFLCIFSLQFFSFPEPPSYKAKKVDNQKILFRPKIIIAPAIDEEAIVINLHKPRCGGFMKAPSH